ncbi:hypothetical protein [Rhodovibrio salinarum]|uniref:Uncharacterized protein n=1 Tax=Rhodovibrio salinarum TaxID=1087 RepID=A0A934V164_9PROT|nr:hypothetical protein [Rhodovibrio salinarum]MBK1698473.1 hypothetical protein [Rhodovibrio salinarum]
MSTVITFPRRHNPVDAHNPVGGVSNPQTLRAKVAELRRLAASSRTATDNLHQAISRLEQLDIRAHAQKIKTAKLESL